MLTRSTMLALQFALITFLMLGWGIPILAGFKPSRTTFSVAVIGATIVLAGALVWNELRG